MDLLRATIKAIYYDYPIENAYGIILGGDKKKGFLTYFNRLACSEDDGFSQREMASYKDYILDVLHRQRSSNENTIQDTVGLPYMFSGDGEVLTKDESDYPCVVFDNLFRWREVVKCIGEDLFTTSYLAKEDAVARSDFFWPSVISHNHKKINEALDKGLTDIHSHFGGAIDSFQLTWICLMNDVEELSGKFKHMKESFNPTVVFDKEYSFQNLSDWCKLAAAIRVILYKVLVKGQSLSTVAVKEWLPEILKSGTEEFTQLKKDIDVLRSEAKQTQEKTVIDYAISEGLITKQFASSPFCIYAGERQIEYAFYREYYNPQSKIIKGAWIEFFYLYELIKTHLRREFVFANEMSGLDSFVGFKARAPLFTKQIEPICNLSSVQTSIRQGKDDYLESRITHGCWLLPQGKYWKGLFTDEDFLKEEDMRNRLTLVIQMPKKECEGVDHTNGRSASKRVDVHKKYLEITNYINSGKSAYEIVGIDVGGLEFFYRPEVFAHALRTAKRQGLGVTFHVGEEFYDLIDGLRAIWEIILYANLNENDRLGHCLSLGVLPKDYYQRKHCTLTMPKQVMLDNIVWLFGFAKQSGILIKPVLQKSLNELAEKIYSDLGYQKHVEGLDMDAFYSSMSLRSDENCADEALDDWSVTAVLDSVLANNARNNEKARRLFKAYNYDEDLIKKGNEPITNRFDNEYVRLVTKVQKKMIELVNGTGLCIESCPSSNLQIGKLERYDLHPSVRYYLNPHSKTKRLNVAICTDDKGTFSTSLANEFSLLALAATKGRGWNNSIEKEFENLISQGRKYRFKKKSNED